MTDIRCQGDGAAPWCRFFQESRDAVVVVDGGGKCMDANRAAHDLLGVHPGSLQGSLLCESFFTESSRSRLEEELAAQGSIRDMEVVLTRTDGSEAICLLTAMLIPLQGTACGFQAILHDITERKMTERLLRRQNEYLAALHETTFGLMGRLDIQSVLETILKRAGGLMKTPHGYVYLFDETGRSMVRRVDTGVFATFGRTSIASGEGLVGTVWQTGRPLAVSSYRSWEGRLPDPARDVLGGVVGVPLTSGTETVGVLGLGYVDEEAAFRQEEIEALTQFARLASLALENARLHEEARQEIAERRRIEQQLRKLSHAVEQSPVVVLITDTAGRIEYVNPKFSESTGYDAHEVVGKTPAILKSGEVPRGVYQELWSTIEAGFDWRGELHNRRKNGGMYWELACISPIRDESGAITHYIAVKEDITDRKRLEDELRHAQKLDAVGQLAGGIAHDFNNILTAIIGYAGFLQMKGGDDPAMARGLAQIITSAERGAELTRGLLAFSRKQMWNPRPVSLNRVLRTAESLLRRLMGVEVELRIDLGADSVIYADTLQIEQVLMNLATNARDAMPSGGTLTIATGTAQVDEGVCRSHGYGTPGRHALLRVSDSGTGMDPEVLKKIFEPFFTTKEVGSGTGLGLSIVYGIIKQHGGYITCESRPRQGTVFSIFLPLSERAEEQPVARERDLPQKGRGETVLVAEDSTVARAL
ncbi:MAG TPA: PAS domain S-box protein, partial [Verrucomicrobiae bacterium]|nr:PAS domain S-box protein [Verrucomicrobiae bacterium]